jgi:choline dehydrogenase
VVAVGAADVPVAVVDPECRIIGAGAPRLVDGSIFPRSANGNFGALTTIMFIDVCSE